VQGPRKGAGPNDGSVMRLGWAGTTLRCPALSCRAFPCARLPYVLPSVHGTPPPMHRAHIHGRYFSAGMEDNLAPRLGRREFMIRSWMLNSSRCMHDMLGFGGKEGGGSRESVLNC
jgi:hypothetical protein